MTRIDGRAPDEMRLITFERDYTEMAAGSVLVSFGKTRVLCTASIDENVPRWMKNTGKGWVTAEYSMLPGASPERIDREAAKGKQSGRTVEIQRLIGRSLRAACDMQLLGERQVVVDCDVLQADGGTRTASICGGYIALHDALSRLVQNNVIRTHPLHSFCAAISVGIVEGLPMLDLPYTEDSSAEVDMNVVMLGKTDGEPLFVEVQGTAEGAAFSRGELDVLLELASGGVSEIMALQREMVSAMPSSPTERAVTMALLRLVCASANPDKVAEIAAILDGVVDLLPRPLDVPEVAEDADTLIGNARLKAAAICAATGLPAVSDDTGLFVDALGGAPGIYAARFAGEDATYADNRAKLLRELGDTRNRTASFVSAVMVVWPDGREVVVEGVCKGTIASTELGDRGFGYDPVFVPDDGDGRSFAQMSDAEKNQISHRARALQALLAALGG